MPSNEPTSTDRFIDILRRRWPDYPLSVDDLSCIAHISQVIGEDQPCLDAIAEMLPTTPLPEIDRALEHGDAQTVFDLVWQTLDGTERDALCQLAVFRGGFTLPSAQAITGISLKMFFRLHNRRLVRRQSPDRYYVPEIFRAAAERHLVTAGESALLRTVHSAYYLDYLVRNAGGLEEEEWPGVIEELDVERENVVAAWTWAIMYPESEAAKESVMTVNVSETRRASLVVVEGRIDHSALEEFRAVLKKQFDAGKNNLIIDMEQVTYINSAVVRELVAALKHTRQTGGSLCLSAPSEQVREVLQIAGLLPLFDVYDDRVSAVGSF